MPRHQKDHPVPQEEKEPPKPHQPTPGPGRTATIDPDPPPTPTTEPPLEAHENNVLAAPVSWQMIMENSINLEPRLHLLPTP